MRHQTPRPVRTPPRFQRAGTDALARTTDRPAHRAGSVSQVRAARPLRSRRVEPMPACFANAARAARSAACRRQGSGPPRAAERLQSLRPRNASGASQASPNGPSINQRSSPPSKGREAGQQQVQLHTATAQREPSEHRARRRLRSPQGKAQAPGPASPAPRTTPHRCRPTHRCRRSRGCSPRPAAPRRGCRGAAAATLRRAGSVHPVAPRRRARASGASQWLPIIRLSESVARITMPVAALRPPRKASKRQAFGPMRQGQGQHIQIGRHAERGQLRFASRVPAAAAESR
jgi:hypothetical protein